MTRFYIFRGSNYHWYWHLRANNNEIIATGGQGYINKNDCLHAIGLVMDTNRNTPVQEV